MTQTKEASPAPAPTWAYEEYSDWARRLAATTPRAELEKRLAAAQKEQDRAASSHLRAIERSHSMQGCAQARAQTGSIVRGGYELRRALQGALDIHGFYPSRALSDKAGAKDEAAK